jgi:hypothetical protein
MNKLNRNNFLKLTAGTALFTAFNKLAAQADAGIGFSNFTDEELMRQLNQANDMQVSLLLESVKPGNLKFGRKTAYDFSVLTAGYCSQGSTYYHDVILISKLDLLIKFLLQSQTSDGTVNIGNLESPPDTAFLVEILGAAASILMEDNHPDTFSVRSLLKEMLQKAGNALVTGGVHTPNHRWVICAALAQLHAVYPNKKYTERIENWLDEGVYNNSDGYYPERSGTYSMVENAAMIAMARFLNKPQLLNHVRKNLLLFYYHIEPDGELASMDSRRQDQYVPRKSNIFYLQYRYLAILDNNKLFAAIAKDMEGENDYQEIILDRSLFYFLENKTLQKQLPPYTYLPDYEKLIPSSHLLRIRRNTITTSFFGGVDWPLIIASGRSCSPNFFTYRKGDAILKYLRLSSAFFSMGYFYSDGLKKTGDSYVLRKKLSVPYYQPLPKDKRNKTGDYKLSPSIDNRFWNKMDFSNRPVSNVKTLDTTITFTEKNGTIELLFDIKGMKDVPVTIELCFKEGGALNIGTADEKGNYFLDAGIAEYKSGKDIIQFGPGAVAHKNITDLEGERYSTHFGTLRTEGIHVYITGKTPFHHTIFFK